MNPMVPEILKMLKTFSDINMANTTGFKIRSLVRLCLIQSMETASKEDSVWLSELKDVKTIENLCSLIVISGSDVDDETCEQMAGYIVKLIKSMLKAYFEEGWNFPVEALKNDLKNFKIEF